MQLSMRDTSLHIQPTLAPEEEEIKVLASATPLLDFYTEPSCPTVFKKAVYGLKDWSYP